MPYSVALEAEGEITRGPNDEPVSTQSNASRTRSSALIGTGRAQAVKNNDVLQQQLTTSTASPAQMPGDTLGLAPNITKGERPGRASPTESLRNGESVRPVSPGSMAFKGSLKSGRPTDSIAAGQVSPTGAKSAEPISQRIGNASGPGSSQSTSVLPPRLSTGDAAPQPPPTGASTPPGRRSVQFARPAVNMDQPDSPYSQRASWEGDDMETPVKERGKQSGIFHKLQKAFAGATGLQTHGRSQSGFTIGGSSIDETPSGPLSPASERGDFAYPSTLEEEDATDADAEESAGDDTGTSPGRVPGRRVYRRASEGVRTEPTTPQSKGTDNSRPGRGSSAISAPVDGLRRPHFPTRRATMTDIPEQSHAVSDGEGRDRLERESPWRKGSSWMHGVRGQSYSGVRGQPPQTPEGRRPRNFRRLTGFVVGTDGGDGSSSPATWHNLAERSSSVSAAKWRALKAGLKMMAPRKRDESRVDRVKSAELLAELTAGAPAALMLASMFQRDEHGNKRIPILLEQLKVRITDSKTMDKRHSSRHMLLRIELEYGSGLTRMKWVIHRELRDFINLHSKYKAQDVSNSLLGEQPPQQKLPHYPRVAIPYYLRGGRGDDDDELDNETGPSAGEGTASATEGRPKRKDRRSFNIGRRRPSDPQASGATTALAARVGEMAGVIGTGSTKKESHNERIRRKMEVYLQQLIRQMIFRADSNRLCKFLELSALGVRLAAEGSYHGKEGYLMIRSAKGLDFRRGWNPSLIAQRHSPKWFLVRHSYIVCVDSPEEMNIYDVFLVDSEFTVETKRNRLRDQKKARDIARSAKDNAAHPKKHHTLSVHNAERDVKLLAKNDRQLLQFEESVKFMISNTLWSRPQRFNSFAPVRKGVFAQWLVDGRDYMWNVSRAISMARDVIYIHDWWLSPELYMRRPAAISQKWRLDRLLQRKASEGVKVFLIMYRNINSAVPIDSEYTKFSMLDLHPNVFVQRSPNQIRQGTFFWAHHEKICVVDHTVAFVGGIDLCFGRWDTPQHSVSDDRLTGFEVSDSPKDADHCQLWPGKDYSNPRVKDFYALDKPYEEMYDRTKVPRMPWHDISMQVVGQPARDLTRHFVQRWNYILRQRRPSRPTPFLLPPPDFVPADLEALGLDGTCEVQILRSCSPWSIGTTALVEHSIMNAYIKLIEQSDHFVYIENQFFISSCEMEGTRIENTIGDALVERIIRAYRNGEDWRATIVIPLMPGFQNTVDSQDGTSVRLIMQCQYRSICRGGTSIFGRLRAQDIDPEDYIQFYSLRSWGKLGPDKMLVTEQLYIHAKCMIVDDRVAIIGSANINERSMLGTRDSECAAIVRDTDMLSSIMAGKPYLVGRFPHTLRVRLMREHLGIDVDEVMEEERRQDAEHKGGDWESDMNRFHSGDGDTISVESPTIDKSTEDKLVNSQHKLQDEVIARSETMFSFNHDVDWERASNPNASTNKAISRDKRASNGEEHEQDVRGGGADQMLEGLDVGHGHGRDSASLTRPKEVLVADAAPEGRGTMALPKKAKKQTAPPHSQAALTGDDLGNSGTPPAPQLLRMTTEELGLTTLSQLPPLPITDDTDIGGAPVLRTLSQNSSDKCNSILSEIHRPYVDKDCMRDPLNDAFHLDIWHAVAENNTKLFRQVFRCMPDNEVKTWKEYKEYASYGERFSQAYSGAKYKPRMQPEPQGKSGLPGNAGVVAAEILGEKVSEAEKKLAQVGVKFGDAMPGRRDFPTGIAKEHEEASDVHTERECKDGDSTERDKKKSNPRIVEFGEKAAVPARSSSEGEPAEFPPLASHTEGGDSEKPERKGETLNKNSTASRRRRRGATRSSLRKFYASDYVIDPAEATELMNMTQGHLVVWPYDWLSQEEIGGNWLYSIDQLAPIEI
ncbi:MAG: Phospholipase D1 [Geoglossum umbratile]|nr:MAG: Phospholipase D1 [Geoglossum umbratile]